MTRLGYLVIALAGCGRLGFDALETDARGADFDATVDVAPGLPSVAGLIGRWMADSPSNTCMGGASCDDAESVDRARDESGLGRDMAQGVPGNRPTFVASCWRGRPCFQFSAGQYLSTASPLPSAAEWTIFAVMRVTSCPGTPTAQAFCPVLIDGTDSHIEGIYVYDGTKQLGLDASDAPFLSSYGASSLSTTAFSYVSASRGAADVYTVYANGSFDGTGTYPAPKVGDAFTHMARDADSTQGFIFVGSIAEILVYDRVVAPVDRAAVDLFLHDKYGF